MATYGSIYEFALTSSNGADILIVISKKFYDGKTTRRPLGRAPILKRENSGRVFGTSLEIYAECAVDGEYAQFYTSSADEFKVEVYKNDIRIWSGFISPELYSEPDIAPPYDVQIIATDGLGELKDYTSMREGITTLREHFNRLLQHTGLSLDFRFASSLEYACDNYIYQPYELCDLSIDLTHDADESCYEELQKLLTFLNARITQFGNRWLIFRETDFINLAQGQTLQVFGSDGTYDYLNIASFGSSKSCPWWPIGQLSSVIKPAKNSLKLSAPNHYKDNVLTGLWEQFDGAVYDNSEGAYNLPVRGSSVKQSIDFSDSIDYRLMLRIKARNVGHGGLDQSLAVQVKMHGISGLIPGEAEEKDYYLWFPGTSDRGPASYTWTTDVKWITPSLAIPEASDTSSDAQDIEIVLPFYYFNYYDRAIARNIEITVQNPSGWHAIYVYDVALYKYDQFAGYEANVKINNGAREEASDVDLTVTNGHDIPVVGSMFMTGIPLIPGNTNKPIDSWRIHASEFREYLSTMALDYSRSMALPRMEYKGILNVPAGGLPALFLRDNTYYFPQTYSYDLYNDELEVSLISVPAAEVEIGSIQISELTGNRGSSGSTGSSNGAGGGSTGGGFGGGGQIVDTEMSDNSSNVVGNNVIKAYVDDQIATVVSRIVEAEVITKKFGYDDDGLFTHENFRSYKQIAVGEVGSPDGGSSGSGVLLLESWSDVPSSLSGYALSAALGIDLHERFNNYYTIGDVDNRFSGINSRLATLDSGMADRYTKDEADALYAKYLPLVGGTITGNVVLNGNLTITRDSGPLYLNVTSEVYPSAVYFFRNLVNYGSLGMSEKNTPSFFDTNNTPYTLVHSGNANKADVPWTASNILFPTGTSATWNTYTIGAYKGITVLNAVQAKPEGAPDHYAVGLSVSGYYGFTLASLGAGDVLLYRRKNETDWKTIAFTDTNVDSAQTLKNSNGTVGATVESSGLVSFASHIVPNNDSQAYVGVANKAWYAVYTNGLWAPSGKTLYLGANNSNHIIVNTSGNVTIGSTDLAGTSAKLAINGDVRIQNNTTTNGDSPKLYLSGLTASDGNVTGPSLQAINSGYYGRKRLAFFQHNADNYTTETEVFSILPNGNVGIGNPDPKAKLHVEGLLYSFSVASASSLSLNRNPNSGAIYSTDKLALAIENSATAITFNAYRGNGSKIGVPLTINDSGSLTASVGISTPHITIGGITISVVEGVLRIDGNVYTTGQLGVGEVGQEGGGTGGGGVLLLNTWPTDGGNSYAGYALGGNLGIDLNTRVKTLEGKATAVSFSQTLTSGKQIGVLTIDGSSETLYAPSTYAWSEITSRPSKLSDFTDDVVSGKYLSLTGGTIGTGTKDAPLALNGISSNVALGLQAGGNSVAYFNWNSYWGACVVMPKDSANYRIGIMPNGTPIFSSGSGYNTLLHSGNIGSYALPLTGGTIEGASGNYTPLIVKNTSLSEVWIAFIDSVGTTHIGSVRGVPSINSGSSNQTILHSGNVGDYALKYIGATSIAESELPVLNTFGLWHTVGAYIRFGISEAYNITIRTSANKLQALMNASKDSDWKTLAFTDSNVASATRSRYIETKYYASNDWYTDRYRAYARWASDNSNILEWATEGDYEVRVDRAKKLQTPRTIWGQSFDGTGNVSGTLTGASSVRYNSDTYYGLYVKGSGFSSTLSDNDVVINAESNVLFCTNGEKRMLINSSGNVLIGTTTDNGVNKLQVSGSIRASFGQFGSILINKGYGNYTGDRTIETTTAGAMLYINYYHNGGLNLCQGGGNVGIGTVNPQYKLDVAGSIRTTSSLTIGTIVLTDENGTLKIAGNAYTTGQLGAGEAGQATSGGGSVILDYDSIVDALGFTPAKQNDLSSLTSRVLALESAGPSSSSSLYGDEITIGSSMGNIYISSENDVQIDSIMGSVLVNGSDVLTKANTSFTRSYTSGTKIGTIKVGGVSTDIYAPASGSSSLWSTEYDITVGTEVLFGSKEYIGTNTIVGWDSAGLCVNDLYIGYDGYTIWMQGSVDEASDMRLKTVIDAVNLDIRDIAFAPIFNYVFKSRPQGRQMLGSSAQYWQPITPSAVSENDKGNLAMNYGAVALASVVAVAKKTLTHEEEIANLKLKVQSLESRLARYELN